MDSGPEQLAEAAGASVLYLPVCNADEVSVDRIQEELRQIPVPILQTFGEQGWSLHIDQSYLEDLRDRYGHTCIAATSYRLHRIYLLESGSVLHEFGHFLDWSMDFPEEIDQRFETEAQGARRPYRP